ncbi:MAG: DNA double-strand break repair nuclease NurA [Anaerolineae bacterium]
MLSSKKTYEALSRKRDAWELAHEQASHYLRQARQALDGLSRLSHAELAGRLEPKNWCGAKPTPEHDLHPDQIAPFGRSFSCHEEAREWATSALLGQPTFAADGSQISPLSEYMLPIGAAQVAWCMNPHDGNAQHVKDLDIEVLLGTELGDREDSIGSRIQTRRFAMEVDAVAAFVERSAATDPKPVCFYDGPLVVSFARNAEAREQYVAAISHLLDVSESTHVPIVGYVASSAARDVVDMLRAADLLPAAGKVHDASLFGAGLSSWGDRSIAYLCARDDDVLSRYPGHDQPMPDYRIAFCYLRTATACPARLELPAWLVRDEVELARVLDVVRAECIIGLGYPYIIEVADQAAYLGGPEREAFKRLVTAFAAENHLDLGMTPKARSKQRRRR